MGPLMRSEMKTVIRSRSEDRCRFMTDVGNVALALPIPFRLPFGAIAVS